MPYISPHDICRIKQIDLLTYLRQREPDELVKIGSHYFAKSHDSLCVSENGLWHWQSRHIGGKTALQYLIKVRGMSFYDAARLLLDNRPVPVPDPSNNTVEPPKNLILPPPHTDNDRVIAYLKERGIHAAVIDYCIQNKMLYESHDYHNAVFVSYDKDGVARYGFLRGTGQQRFARDAEGSDKRCSFCIPAAVPSKTLIKTEGAVDVLSLATFARAHDPDGWMGYHYLSGGGASSLPIERHLTDYPEISTIYLCNDSDPRGRAMSVKQKEAYTERGYTIYDSPPPLLPASGKDYNDLLRLGRTCPGFPPPVISTSPRRSRRPKIREHLL